jgi:hypothetical protein
MTDNRTAIDVVLIRVADVRTGDVIRIPHEVIAYKPTEAKRLGRPTYAWAPINTLNGWRFVHAVDESPAWPESGAVTDSVTETYRVLLLSDDKVDEQDAEQRFLAVQEDQLVELQRPAAPAPVRWSADGRLVEVLSDGQAIGAVPVTGDAGADPEAAALTVRESLTYRVDGVVISNEEIQEWLA